MIFRHLLLSAAVAAIISLGIVTTLHNGAPPPVDSGTADGPGPLAAATAPATVVATEATAAVAGRPGLRYTDALVEDVWVNGARTPGDDHRSLTDAENSICFITKIEISGIQSPEDTSSCEMQIDGFTGFWDLVATVQEGSQSEIRCNARCLIWEEE